MLSEINGYSRIYTIHHFDIYIRYIHCDEIKRMLVTLFFSMCLRACVHARVRGVCMRGGGGVCVCACMVCACVCACVVLVCACMHVCMRAWVCVKLVESLCI